MIRCYEKKEEPVKDEIIRQLEEQHRHLRDEVESLGREVDDLMKIYHAYNEVSQALCGKDCADVQDILAAYDQAKNDDTPMMGSEIVKSTMNVLLKKIRSGKLYEEDVTRMAESIANLGDTMARLIAEERRNANDKRYEKHMAQHEKETPAESDPEGAGHQV